MFLIKRCNTLIYNWSDKHKDYMKCTQLCSYNIAEGSIRSGKTTDNVFCFAKDIKLSKDKIHLATASTQPTAKLIVGDCDGFGLEHIFRGQCRWGKYKGNECLIINGIDTNYKDKIILFCGGAKADSYKKFRGMTIGLWIATEINLHHDNTIQEALKRQIKAHTKKLYWDLNPGSPVDPVYVNYIDKWQNLYSKDKLLGGFNYKLFNIFDNINIPKKNLDEVLSRYEVGSLFYKRDILGLRYVAEGSIYKIFSDNPNKYIVDEPDFNIINIGVDFGGNNSAHAFCAVGIKYDYSKLTVLMTEKHNAKGTSPESLYSLFGQFISKVKTKYKKDIEVVYADSAEQVLINGLKSRFPLLAIKNSLKLPIIDRIRATTALMASNKLCMTIDCEILNEAFCNAVYDEKSIIDKRLDNGISDIDSLDAFEYSWEKYMKLYVKS